MFRRFIVYMITNRKVGVWSHCRHVRGRTTSRDRSTTAYYCVLASFFPDIWSRRRQQSVSDVARGTSEWYSEAQPRLQSPADGGWMDEAGQGTCQPGIKAPSITHYEVSQVTAVDRLASLWGVLELTCLQLGIVYSYGDLPAFVERDVWKEKVFLFD